MAEYRLAPKAERDMEDIWQYTRAQWGLEQAHRYTDRLIAAFEELAASPKTAPLCDHIRKDYRRQIAGRHVIYFRVTEYGIAIIRILHAQMDPQRHL
jgi:toxin ParE1/3/4